MILSNLAQFTRKLPLIPGLAKIAQPLIKASSQPGESQWNVIDDYQGDVKILVDRFSYIGGNLYWLGYHHWREMKYLKKFLKPEMVFLDIGANVGEFTLAAAKLLDRGRVIAFEPHPNIYRQLGRSVELNNYNNVSLFNLALGKKSGELELYGPSDAHNEGMYSLIKGAVRTEIVAKVPIETLDEIVERESLERVDFIKIDVEGAELFVLQGGTKTLERHKPTMLIEFSEETFREAGYKPSDLKDFLDRYGYEYYSFSKWRGNPEAITGNINESTKTINVLCVRR